MSKNLLDNGTVLTLGLVGAVAAIGVAAKRGVYGSRSTATSSVMERLMRQLNGHGSRFEMEDDYLIVDDDANVSIVAVDSPLRPDAQGQYRPGVDEAVEPTMVEVAKRKLDRSGNLVGMKVLGQFSAHDAAGIARALSSHRAGSMKGSRSRGSRAMVSEGIYKDISLPAAELGEKHGREMVTVDVNTQDEDWGKPWLVTVGSGYSSHHFVVFGSSEDSALAHAIETAVVTAPGWTARPGDEHLEESLREYDGEGYATDDGSVYLGHFDSLHIRRIGNDVRPLLKRHGVSLEGEGSSNRGSRSRSRGSRATAIPKFIGEAGEAGNYYYWAIKVAGVDPRFPMKSFGRQLEDYEKLKEWKKSAKQDYISTKSRKGQKPKTELRRWLESVKPSEFYVKWDLGVDDDTRLIYYKD